MLRAQAVLDQNAKQQATIVVSLPDGTLELPPLWFHVQNAELEVSMATTVNQGRLTCNLVNPLSVALYGYQASAGTRVRLILAPKAD